MKIKNKRLIEIVQSAFSWIKIREHNLFRLMIFLSIPNNKPLKKKYLKKKAYLIYLNDLLLIQLLILYYF